jgi:hypothetical protein
MLGAQGRWAGSDLYRATPAVTRDLGFSGLIRRTAPFRRLSRHTRGWNNSNPDPHGGGECERGWSLAVFEIRLRKQMRFNDILIFILTEPWKTLIVLIRSSSSERKKKHCQAWHIFNSVSEILRSLLVSYILLSTRCTYFYIFFTFSSRVFISVTLHKCWYTSIQFGNGYKTLFPNFWPSTIPIRGPEFTNSFAFVWSSMTSFNSLTPPPKQSQIYNGYQVTSIEVMHFRFGRIFKN